ncbi:MAG TPA: hypothetical protein VLX44_16525 [Xanthobacteraceae bacterium]|nr:hypothetical protein [Xanthobacteraceae bacterium]
MTTQDRVPLPDAPPLRRTAAAGAPPPLILVGAAMLLALAATVWLWVHVGTAIFFETIRAGLAACGG